MIEIEVKILEIDPEKIRKKLEEIGAKKTAEGIMKSTLFDNEDGEMKKENQTLRLRKWNGKTEFCFKKKGESKEFKQKEEIETLVDDFDAASKILNGLGFTNTRYYEKKRESYALGNIHFEIDTYPKIPAFIEVEAPTQEEVKKGVEMLGFTMDQTTAMSAVEVIEEKYRIKSKDCKF
jgi:adenylate cyclase class 2